MTQSTAARITVYPPELQGRGSFDGGKITEIKPIGFPHEGSAVRRVGPLFYWAWAVSNGYAKIELHPHRSFEIMSYVLEGEIGHYDTGDHRSHVGKGGAQLIQAGSGISHSEELLGDHTEMFQIWFEPEMQAAATRAPEYHEFQAPDLPTESVDGVTITSVLGEGGPVRIVADASFRDYTFEPSSEYAFKIAAGRGLAVVTIAGSGDWQAEGGGGDDAAIEITRQDFSVIEATEETRVIAKAGANGLRLAVVEVPLEVDYPLYPKG